MSTLTVYRVTMDFREAVERLNATDTREKIARELGVSFFSVRQALLPEGSKSKRPPPRGWRHVLARLARERATRLQELADELERATGDP